MLVSGGDQKSRLTSCAASCVHEEAAIADSECLLYAIGHIQKELLKMPKKP